MFMKILILFSVIGYCSMTYFDHSGWFHIELFHALDIEHPNEFTRRGNISMSSLNADNFKVTQIPVTENIRMKLKKLAEADQFYRLKAEFLNSNGNKIVLLTSSKACTYVNSRLFDALWISLDHQGSIIGISQTMTSGGIKNNCGAGEIIIGYDGLDEFNTEIFVKPIEQGPIPDTASFIQKMERDRDARERGEVKDNRGFFAKYWMYIVPVAILVLLSTATSPEAGGAR